MFWTQTVCAAALVFSHLTYAIPTISIKGSKFFTANGDQFYIKGIAYQLSPDDPLVDETQCRLDIALMSQLKANTIRVYHVDPTADHSGCMAAFAEAGIYLFVDLDTFSTQIEQTNPMWTPSQLSAFEAVMDEFQQYDNTAGFFVGNEVLTEGATSGGAPYIKAAARDVKAYRDRKGYRKIPVGYSAADIPDLRPQLQNYLACGSDPSEAVDFYSLNAYEWCGMNTFDGSGYSNLLANAAGYNIPIFLSETGCIIPPPRYFQDQAAILGPDMDNVFSGAIVYEWIWEENSYGLVAYSSSVEATFSHAPTNYVRAGTPTPVLPDFTNLMSQWATLSPTGVQANAYQPSLTPPPCPPYSSPNWLVNGNVPLPTLGQQVNPASGAPVTSGMPSEAPTSSPPPSSSSATLTSSSSSSSSASASPSLHKHTSITSTHHNAKPSPVGLGEQSAATSAPTASTTGGAAAGRELQGLTVGLTGVLLSFIWWL